MLAKFIHGKPLMVDYTPSGADVKAGDVLVVGGAVRIAHNNIADGKLGSLAAGGGVYDIPKAGGGGVTFADGANVYWDAGNKVASTNNANKRMGMAIKAAADADTSVRVQHIPN